LHCEICRGPPVETSLNPLQLRDGYVSHDLALNKQPTLVTACIYVPFYSQYKQFFEQ
jgi:hypothetical protein